MAKTICPVSGKSTGWSYHHLKCRCVTCRTEENRQAREWRTKNKTSQRARIHNYYLANREKFAMWGKTSRYGITKEQYDRLLAQQNNTCAVCPATGKLFIDHDHSSGKIRGLLCPKCNLGIGHFKDSPALLTRAASYLKGI